MADQGLGIPADALARVFEKFYRVAADDRRAITGTGLGLAIVKELVEAHGGEVGVSSAGPGLGARFWFSLPLAASGLVELPQLASNSVSFSHRVREFDASADCRSRAAAPLRVLSVDDDRATGAALARLLRPDGHQVVAVSSGDEALRRLMEQPFDVVLSDLGLGQGMDGWELARRVRAEWPGVQFVLASGSVSVSDLEAHRRGIDAVLAKPFLPEDLRRLLGGLRPARAGLDAA